MMKMYSPVRRVELVFTESVDENANYEGLMHAMDEARKNGIAAVTYKGDMVDEAMVKTAHEIIALGRLA